VIWHSFRVLPYELDRNFPPSIPVAEPCIGFCLTDHVQVRGVIELLSVAPDLLRRSRSGRERLDHIGLCMKLPSDKVAGNLKPYSVADR